MAGPDVTKGFCPHRLISSFQPQGRFLEAAQRSAPYKSFVSQKGHLRPREEEGQAGWGPSRGGVGGEVGGGQHGHHGQGCQVRLLYSETADEAQFKGQNDLQAKVLRATVSCKEWGLATTLGILLGGVAPEPTQLPTCPSQYKNPGKRGEVVRQGHRGFRRILPSDCQGRGWGDAAILLSVLSLYSRHASFCAPVMHGKAGRRSRGAACRPTAG